MYSLIWLKSDLGGTIVVQVWTSQIVPVVGIQYRLSARACVVEGYTSKCHASDKNGYPRTIILLETVEVAQPFWTHI